MNNINVGSADRVFRVIWGLVVLAIRFLSGSVAPGSGLGSACFVGAAIMIGTASLSFCPIYRILGLRTTPNTNS